MQLQLNSLRTGKMPPNYLTGVLYENDTEVVTSEVPEEITKPDNRKPVLVWRNIILMGYLHLAAIYGLFLLSTSAKWKTVLFATVMHYMGILGITAGAHRLWSHRSYKAKWPLRVILVIFNAIAFQDAAADWARDHRAHHKYCETDADPQNPKRGLFFAHIGWLFCRKHPEVKVKGEGIDKSDLYADPILMFQKKHYLVIMNLCCFILPTVIPIYLWEESLSNAFFSNLFRYALSLNTTWLINSAGHRFGSKPYDRFINPVDNNFVSFFAIGEGWHNYHHTFPWDYKTSELGKSKGNFTTLFLNLMAKIGWAYDMKTVSDEVIKRRVERTGDGSHNVWGWGDKDQTAAEREKAVIENRRYF